MDARTKSRSPVVLVVAAAVFMCVIVLSEASDELEEQMRVLSKQVTTLLDRRREDLEMIEGNLQKKLERSPELMKVQKELERMRHEMREMRPDAENRHVDETQSSPPQLIEKNDRLTLKWLSNTVAELKTELIEVQNTLNSTVILQNHEQLDTELSLLRSDVSNLNKQLEIARRQNAKYEADLLESREEIASLKDNSRTTAVVCGRTKNQLKAIQLEWNHNWKVLNERTSTIDAQELTAEGPQNHASRHQRYLKKHITNLEKTSKNLHRDNEHLKTKLLKLEEEMKLLQGYVKDTDVYDTINGNEIQDFVRTKKLKVVPDENFQEQLRNLSREQTENSLGIANLTQQLTNFDKLHLSMLELLENVEAIENKVDKTVPEFRKEISKLEVQLSEAVANLAMLKEEETNTRNSVKAISVSVSNMQDKVDGDHEVLLDNSRNVKTLMMSNSLQTSKLHDHILKAESQTVDQNTTTKATIHLVQELRTFANEYKSIVNKLPTDCSAVDGPTGIYLISPGDGEPILAHCDAGWTTIQKRYEGSVDFNRNWNEYSNGFGSATGEHWLGNRNLHYLTKENCSRLQINMKDIYGGYWQANYDDFRVADYTLGFKLAVDKYKGNASDALDYQNRMEFSTIDNDRDISNTHCASNYEGGWWFSHCQHANLNGRYNLGLTWFDSSRNEWIAVSHSEMRVKRRDHC